MKKIIVALLAFAMVFAFTSCDNDPALKEMTVGVRLGQHVRGESEDGGNWKSAVLSMEGDVVTIKADLEAMTLYNSTAGQGKAKWLALLIDTGISDLANVVYNGEVLGNAGANEYKDLKGVDVDGTAGKATEMVLWIKAEDAQYTSGRPITLSYDGYVEKEITIKVENVELVTVRTADDFTTAIAGDKKVVLSNDVALTKGVTFTKAADIDLNGHKLSSTAKFVATGAEVSLSNGELDMDVAGISKTNSSIELNADSTLNLTNVTYTSNVTGIFSVNNNDNVTVNITKSTVDVDGYYGIGTNATQPDESQNVKFNITDSTITTAGAEGTDGDNTAILFNVHGGVTLTNSTVSGDRQAMIARGGEHSFTNTTFEATGANSIDKSASGQYLTQNWGTGNEVPLAALVVGNRSSSAYDYPTSVTLSNVTLKAPEKNTADIDYYGMYVWQNDETNTVKVSGSGSISSASTNNKVNVDNMNGATYEE